jgi:ribosomal protein S24E
MKIIEDKQNDLLNRREIKMVVEASKNPSFPDALKLISEHFKTSEELVEVYEIKGKFGRDTFLISASIYKTKEDKNKTEKKKKKAVPAQSEEKK